MLEEAADQRDHPDVVRQTDDAGPEQAAVAHDQVHVHAGLGGLVEGGDEVLVGEGVGLQLDEPGVALGLVFDLALDAVEQGLLENPRAG